MKNSVQIFENRNDLIRIFKKNSKILEIGVFKGEFSKFILETLEPEELFLVDIFEGYAGSGDKDGNNMVYTQLEEEYNNLKKLYSKNNKVHVIKSTSSEFLKNTKDEFFDLVYVDGDHEYNSVKKDLNNSLPKIKNNGYLCGHDYVSPRFDGVVKAVDEFCIENNLKINYLTKDGCPSYCIKKI